MANVIEAYNYKIGLDASALQAGGTLTRRELGQLKRDFYSLQDPVERSAGKLNRLANALNKGAIDYDRYTESVNRIKATYPETIAAQKAQSDTERQAAAIKRSLMTETQLVGVETKRLGEFVRAGKLTFDEARQALVAYKATLPSAAAAARELAARERELADAQREVQRITRAGLSDSQRYAAERSRLTNLVRNHGLAEAEARRELVAYRSTLPSVIAAERQRSQALAAATAIVRQNETATESYKRKVAELQQLHRSGALDARNYGIALRRIKDEQTQTPATPTAGPNAMLGSLKALAAGYVGIGAITSTFQKSFEMEDARKSMDVFAGSVENGKRLFEELQGLQASSPVIGFDKYANAAQTLLAYNASLDSIVPSLHMLGNLSAGNQEKFSRLAFAFGQVTAAGVLQGDELRQLVEAGFNPLQIISIKTGESMVSLKKRMSEGQISVEMVRDAMETVTGPGGRFFGLLEERSKTASGSLAKMRGEVTRLQAELGTLYSDDLAAVFGSIASGIKMLRGGDRDSSTDSELFKSLKSGLATVVTPITATGRLWRTMQESIASNGESFDVASAWLNGMSADLYEVGEGLLTIDFGRLKSGLSGDVTSGLLRGLEDTKIAAKEAAEALASVKPPESGGYAGSVSAAERQAIFAKQDALDKPVIDEINALKDRNAELAGSTELAKEYKLLNSEAAIHLKAEYQDLVKRNQELERASKIKEQTDGLEKQLKLARELDYIRVKSPGIDQETAGQLAELKLLGATGTELNRHLALRREIVAIEGRKQAQDTRAEEMKKLAEDAKQIRESLQSPLEGLASDFGKLTDMYTAGMLSAEEYAAAKQRAAKELVKLPSDVGTKAVSFGDGSDVYAGLVESQNARDKRTLENLEAEKLRQQAERLAQREEKRFEASKLVTGQMREQAKLAEQINQINPNAPGGTGIPSPSASTAEDDEVLGRIASACERAADRLSDWQIIGV